MKTEVLNTAIEAIKTGIYKKNIHYIWKPGARTEEAQLAKILGGSPGMISWMAMQTYYQHGIQMHVSKDVSTDLLATDFSAASKIENIPWPAPAIELYFEDPSIPSIMVMKTLPTQLQKWFPQIDIQQEEVEHITAIIQCGSDENTAEVMSLQIIPSMYDAFLNDGIVPPMIGNSLFSTSIGQADNAVICFMIHLALKVFVFASIPTYKPAYHTKKRMIFGGKPGIKGRPDKRAFRVTYLPKMVYQRTASQQEPESKKEFHGRLGHMRWYRNEYFVKKKGTWDFMQPIADPKTGKYPERTNIFKVIKHKQPQQNA